MISEGSEPSKSTTDTEGNRIDVFLVEDGGNLVVEIPSVATSWRDGKLYHQNFYQQSNWRPSRIPLPTSDHGRINFKMKSLWEQAGRPPGDGTSFDESYPGYVLLCTVPMPNDPIPVLNKELSFGGFIVGHPQPFPRNSNTFTIDGISIIRENEYPSHRFGGFFNDYLILTERAAASKHWIRLEKYWSYRNSHYRESAVYSVPKYTVLWGGELIFPHHTINLEHGLDLVVNRNQLCFMNLIPQPPKANDRITPHIFFLVDAPLGQVCIAPDVTEISSLGRDPSKYENKDWETLRKLSWTLPIEAIMLRAAVYLAQDWKTHIHGADFGNLVIRMNPKFLYYTSWMINLVLQPTPLPFFKDTGLVEEYGYDFLHDLAECLDMRVLTCMDQFELKELYPNHLHHKLNLFFEEYYEPIRKRVWHRYFPYNIPFRIHRANRTYPTYTEFLQHNRHFIRNRPNGWKWDTAISRPPYKPRAGGTHTWTHGIDMEVEIPDLEDREKLETLRGTNAELEQFRNGRILDKHRYWLNPRHIPEYVEETKPLVVTGSLLVSATEDTREYEVSIRSATTTTRPAQSSTFMGLT